MKTKIGGYDAINEAAELIKRGEIVAFPTETVYGLGGNALDKYAIEKIYIAKNRPKDNPFIVHVTDIEQAQKVAYVSDEAKSLFNKFAPGPITLVLPKKDCVPYEATAGLDTVGIRMPSHPMCREFLKACDLPIAAPSANVSKRVSPTKAEYVFEDMDGRIPLILDGGECQVGIESTVLSLCTDVPTILRPGIITAEKLIEFLPAVRMHTGEVKVAPAPGMKYKHYAPTVPCYMFDGTFAAIRSYDQEVNNGSVPVILAKGDIERFGSRNAISMGKDGAEIAHSVFALLRECEKKYGFILIEKLSDSGEEGSVMNRIIKSCEGKILS